MKSLTIAAGLLVGLSACAPEEPPPVYEFVCYTDGKVTEHHVQVTDAYVAGYTDTWKLSYKDGLAKWSYTPQQGETCGLE